MLSIYSSTIVMFPYLWPFVRQLLRSIDVLEDVVHFLCMGSRLSAQDCNQILTSKYFTLEMQVTLQYACKILPKQDIHTHESTAAGAADEVEHLRHLIDFD